MSCGEPEQPVGGRVNSRIGRPPDGKRPESLRLVEREPSLVVLTGSADDELSGKTVTTRRLTMSEQWDLIEQLRRSNRRWKALALAACSILVLVAVAGFVAMSRQQMLSKELMRAMEQAAANAHHAANSGQAR
jgi:hypothetical protein